MSDERSVFDGRAVLAVTAHPDDEALAFGGTLARCAATGGRTALVCLTRGELGWAGEVPRPSQIPELARRREQELRVSAGILGIGTVRLLDFPDSRLKELPYAPMVAAIKAAVIELEPDLVVTFGEDGLYWHDDHTVVYYTTMRAMLELGPAAPPVYHAVLRRGMMREVLTAAVGSRVDAHDLRVWGLTPDAFGLHASAPQVAVDVMAFVPQKMRALRSHHSQFPPDHPFVRLADRDALRLLGTEYFYKERVEATQAT